jgi:hypothetical protein
MRKHYFIYVKTKLVTFQLLISKKLYMKLQQIFKKKGISSFADDASELAEEI